MGTTLVDDGEAVTVVRRGGAHGERATVVEVADGLVRVRFLRRVAGGWAAVADSTHEDPDPVDPKDPDAPLALLEAA